MKSSKTTRATEFKPVDSELCLLKIGALSLITSIHAEQTICKSTKGEYLVEYLRAPLNTPATKRPGTPVKFPTVSITK